MVTFIFLRGLCGYACANILTLSPPRVLKIKEFTVYHRPINASLSLHSVVCSLIPTDEHVCETHKSHISMVAHSQMLSTSCDHQNVRSSLPLVSKWYDLALHLTAVQNLVTLQSPPPLYKAFTKPSCYKSLCNAPVPISKANTVNTVNPLYLASPYI